MTPHTLVTMLSLVFVPLLLTSVSTAEDSRSSEIISDHHQDSRSSEIIGGHHDSASGCRVLDREVICSNIQNMSSVLDVLSGEHTKVTGLTLDNCQECQDCADIRVMSDPSVLLSLEDLTLIRCQNGTKIFTNFLHFFRLRSLTIKQSSLENFEYNCESLNTLENLDLSENNLEQFSLDDNACAERSSLRLLNLSNNNFREFDMRTLDTFPLLETLLLSHNDQLSAMTPTPSVLPRLATLDLSNNPALGALCEPLLQSLPRLSRSVIHCQALNSISTPNRV